MLWQSHAVQPMTSSLASSCLALVAALGAAVHQHELACFRQHALHSLFLCSACRWPTHCSTLASVLASLPPCSKDLVLTGTPLMPTLPSPMTVERATSSRTTQARSRHGPRQTAARYAGDQYWGLGFGDWGSRAQCYWRQCLLQGEIPNRLHPQ